MRALVLFLSIGLLHSADYCSSLPARSTLPWNGLAAKPWMGWNSWYVAGTNINDLTVRFVADQFVARGLKDAGYTYVNLDDGWQGTRDGSGNIQANPDKFSDIAATAAYVHSKGLKFGIYANPSATSCAGAIGSVQHEAQDATTFASWGVDFMKYDWCNADLVYPSCYTTELDRVYQLMASSIRSTGRDIVMSGLGIYPLAATRNPWEYGFSAGYNSWRITDDLYDSDYLRFCCSAGNTIDRMATIAAYQQVGGYNDADYLIGGNGSVTDTQARQQFTMMALWSSPLVLSNSMNMSSDLLAMYTNAEVIAVDQDDLVKQATRLSSVTCGSGKCDVWKKQMSNGAWAVGLVNRDSASHAMTVDFADVAAGTFSARDVWAASDLGSASSHSATVPAYDVVLLKLTPNPTQAVLETWASLRTKNNGEALWAKAGDGSGECNNGASTFTVSDSKGINGTSPTAGNCPYAHFFPNASAGYSAPQGYAKYYIESGEWNAQYNRLTYTMTCDAAIVSASDGWANYVRDPATTDSAYQGQHYYHGQPMPSAYFNVPIAANRPVTWILNRTPNHMVSQSANINWPNDPEWVFPTGNDTGTPAPVHYFDGLTRFYLNPTRQQAPTTPPPSQCSYGPLTFTLNSHNEPDEYVYTALGQYDGSKYNVAWKVPNNDSTVYEVRYSTADSLHTNGLSTGASGGTVQAQGDTYNAVGWSSPAMSQASSIWVAIRPRPAVSGATGNSVSPVRLSFHADPMYATGDEVTVSGVTGNAAANGTYTVTPVPRQFWKTSNGSVVSIVVSGGTGTVTTSSAHNLKVGQVAMIYWGAGDDWAYAPYKTITATPSGTTFQFATSEPSGTYNSGTGDIWVWSAPAIDLVGTTGNGAYAGGGYATATSDTANFTEIVLEAGAASSGGSRSSGRVTVGGKIQR